MHEFSIAFALLRQVLDIAQKNRLRKIERVEIGVGILQLVVPEALETASQKLLKAGFEILSKDLVMQPKTLVEIKESAKKEKVLKFIEGLDDHDDVQKVFANFDLTD